MSSPRTLCAKFYTNVHGDDKVNERQVVASADHIPIYRFLKLTLITTRARKSGRTRVQLPSGRDSPGQVSSATLVACNYADDIIRGSTGRRPSSARPLQFHADPPSRLDSQIGTSRESTGRNLNLLLPQIIATNCNWVALEPVKCTFHISRKRFVWSQTATQYLISLLGFANTYLTSSFRQLICYQSGK